jgi:crotonobetainyl-CoA:carnitine CoA-transferase CaiB-like acyl-CoA transferase
MPEQQPASAALPALSGVRVLDLSRVLAGPWCTQILGDLGAEVIKIENPAGGDDTRAWGPPYAGGEAAYYLCANRNKKSVAVDLATAEGQAVIRQLAQGCDVLVENFKTGGLDKYGLGYEAIRELNPAIVYCSISGYGRTSPLADRAGYDYVIQAEGGLMSVTGEADGEPMKVGVAVADLFTGMGAAQAILAAIMVQRRDGVGQHIDMSLFDSQLAMLANVGAAHLASGSEPRRYGNGHPAIVPYQTFETAKGPIVVAVGNDRQFLALCRDVLEQPQIAADPRFARNKDRVGARDTLVPILARAFLERPAEHWLQRMRAAGIPCGAVRTVGQALASPETLASGMVRTVPHHTAGEVALIASPLKLSRTPVVDPTAPPLLGQHTEEVLAALARGDFQSPPTRR